MNRFRAGMLAALVAGSGAVGASTLVPAGAESPGTTIYGLTTDDRIVTIDTAAADPVTSSVPVTGLAADESLIGIDRRPNGGAVYAVGQAGTTGRLYTVDPTSGIATFVAKLTVAPNPAGATSCAGQAVGSDIVLSGTNFGLDFNPVPDALRIVSDSGQNLRALPSARNVPRTATADNPATTQPAALGATFCDGGLNYAGVTATGVAAAAYTNSDNVMATGTTTLYDLDTLKDDLVVQNPPNAGSLTMPKALGKSTGPLAGFDILTMPTSNPAEPTNTAYVALTKDNGGSKLYTIDLATGGTTAIGSVGSKDTLKGIAL